MKQSILCFFATMACAGVSIPVAAVYSEPSSDNLEHHTYEVVIGDVFYDGYNTAEVLDKDKEDGVTRHTNYLHEYYLDPKMLLDVHENLRLTVELNPLCDNYDRMGRVMLHFYPKGYEGEPDYNGENGQRIELARFITPFMNKNRFPIVVPYEYDLSDLSYILNDYQILNAYDLYLQVEVFGVPYDAQIKVNGCAGRQDVFAISATLSWDSLIPLPTTHPADLPNPYLLSSPTTSLVPVYTAKTEIHGNVNLNNYKEEATDLLGTTSRTFKFDVDKDLKYSRLTLISTPHGAGENGEEYVRRTHFVYVDGELVHTFIPGGESCEPYRKYNTQGNFIYGFEPQDDWEEWNNWCPGQAVPIRRIDLGELEQGEHTVTISVPDAEFYGQDGDIRPSMYLLGSTFMPLGPVGIEEINADRLEVDFTREGDLITFLSDIPVSELTLYSIDGRLLEGHYHPGNTFSLADYAKGEYILLLIGENGQYESLKLVK